MNLLAELNALLIDLGIPVETGVFSGPVPDEYTVITPLADTFDLYADDRPEYDIQEAGVSLFSKGNYNTRKNQIVRALLNHGFTVTARRYVGYENDTQYHSYVIDVAKQYYFEEDM